MLNDSVENDTYQSRIATLREEQEQLKARLETADDDRKYDSEDEIAPRTVFLSDASRTKSELESYERLRC